MNSAHFAHVIRLFTSFKPVVCHDRKVSQVYHTVAIDIACDDRFAGRDSEVRGGCFPLSTPQRLASFYRPTSKVSLF